MTDIVLILIFSSNTVEKSSTYFQWEEGGLISIQRIEEAMFAGEGRWNRESMPATVDLKAACNKDVAMKKIKLI